MSELHGALQIPWDAVAQMGPLLDALDGFFGPLLDALDGFFGPLLDALDGLAMTLCIKRQ